MPQAWWVEVPRLTFIMAVGSPSSLQMRGSLTYPLLFFMGISFCHTVTFPFLNLKKNVLCACMCVLECVSVHIHIEKPKEAG